MDAETLSLIEAAFRAGFEAGNNYGHEVSEGRASGDAQQKVEDREVGEYLDNFKGSPS